MPRNKPAPVTYNFHAFSLCPRICHIPSVPYRFCAHFVQNSCYNQGHHWISTLEASRHSYYAKTFPVAPPLPFWYLGTNPRQWHIISMHSPYAREFAISPLSRIGFVLNLYRFFVISRSPLNFVHCELLGKYTNWNGSLLVKIIAVQSWGMNYRARSRTRTRGSDPWQEELSRVFPA